MEDLGDYIYLILLVLAGMSGIFSKKKKESNTQEKKKPVINLPKSWEEFEQQTTTRSQKPVVKAQTTQREFKPERTIMDEGVSGEIIPGEFETGTFLTYDSVDDTSKMRAKKTVTKSFKSKPDYSLPDIAEQEMNTTFTLDNPESARAAFIYSEIFNRKYN